MKTRRKTSNLTHNCFVTNINIHVDTCTFNRIGGEKSSILQKQDQQFFTGAGNVDVWWETLKPMIINFDLAWKHYIKNTGADDAYRVDFCYTSLKIQKTLPTEGYHVWHIEHGKGFDNEPRAFVFSVYLNDVEDGGETYFEHYDLKIKPEIGKTLIWPAEWTHAHKGEVLKSGLKYIVTGWMHFPFNFQVPQKV